MFNIGLFSAQTPYIIIVVLNMLFFITYFGNIFNSDKEQLASDKNKIEHIIKIDNGTILLSNFYVQFDDVLTDFQLNKSYNSLLKTIQWHILSGAKIPNCHYNYDLFSRPPPPEIL